MFIQVERLYMQKILIIKTHAIGDLLMSSCGIRETKKAFPESEITLLTGKWSVSIVENNPFIDKRITFDDSILFQKKIFSLLKLILEIRKERFDMAFIYHQSPLIHLLAYFGGVKNRYGFYRSNSRFLTGFIEEKGSNHYYYPKNFVNLLEASGVTPTEDYSLDVFPRDSDRKKIEELFIEENIVLSKKLILIAPGGSHNSKEKVSARVWPLEKYVDLIALINKENPVAQIVITGGPTDKETAEAIIAKSSVPIFNICGKSSLLGSAVVIEKSALLICNDSSLLHVALAQGTPVSCIFGPTAIETRVPANKKQYCVQSKTECSPCYQFGGFPGCDIDIACMHSITPQDTFNKIKPLLLENTIR